MRLIYAFICLAVMVGCRMNPKIPNDVVAEELAATNHVSVVSVRYAASVGNGGAETVEVVVRNGTKKPVSFVKAELDGTELPKIVPSAQKALDVFRRDVGSKKGRMSVPSVSGVRWWQFYPSPDIPAGGYAAFQFNFTERSRPCDLVLTTSDGQRVPVRIPRYSKPKRRIEYLAFTGGGGSMMTLRYSKGTPPSSVSLNGIPLAGFKDLGTTGPGHPGALAANLPRLIKEGDAVLLYRGGIGLFPALQQFRPPVKLCC